MLAVRPRVRSDCGGLRRDLHWLRGEQFVGTVCPANFGQGRRGVADDGEAGCLGLVVLVGAGAFLFFPITLGAIHSGTRFSMASGLLAFKRTVSLPTATSSPPHLVSRAVATRRTSRSSTPMVIWWPVMTLRHLGPIARQQSPSFPTTAARTGTGTLERRFLIESPKL